MSFEIEMNEKFQVLTDKLEIDAIFSRVEWTTLIFFASLFVVMEVSLAQLQVMIIL
jgi:Na+/H+ antiporter NhaD/arsenite permease-like protein